MLYKHKSDYFPSQKDGWLECFALSEQQDIWNGVRERTWCD